MPYGCFSGISMTKKTQLVKHTFSLLAGHLRRQFRSSFAHGIQAHSGTCLQRNSEVYNLFYLEYLEPHIRIFGPLPIGINTSCRTQWHQEGQDCHLCWLAGEVHPRTL